METIFTNKQGTKSFALNFFELQASVPSSRFVEEKDRKGGNQFFPQHITKWLEENIYKKSGKNGLFKRTNG